MSLPIVECEYVKPAKKIGGSGGLYGVGYVTVLCLQRQGLKVKNAR